MRCNSDMGHKVMTSPTGRKPWYVVGHCMLSHWFTSSLHTITLYEHTGPVADAPRFPRPPPPAPLPLALHPSCLPPSPPPPGPRGSPQSTGTVLLSGKPTVACLVRSPPSRYSGEPIRIDYRVKNLNFRSNARSSGRRIAAARLRDERSDLTMSLRDNCDALGYQPCKFERQRLI